MLPVAQTILRNLGQSIPLFEESPTTTPVVPATPTAEPVAPTATPLPPLPTPTAVPVPSPWAPDQWLRSTGWVANFHGVFLVLFLATAVAAVIVYFFLAQRMFKNHSLHARLAERVSLVLTAFSSVGLVFLLFSLARAPLLGAPIWLILSMVALIAAAIYGGYYYMTVYPVALAKYNREQERLRYLPKGRTKGPAYTPPMRHKQQGKGGAAKQQGKGGSGKKKAK